MVTIILKTFSGLKIMLLRLNVNVYLSYKIVKLYLLPFMHITIIIPTLFFYQFLIHGLWYHTDYNIMCTNKTLLQNYIGLN